MYKKSKFGSEGRKSIKKGIDRATNHVSPTLGAVGMSALIDFDGLDPVSSDDGVTILKNLEFKDKYENLGLKMLRKGAVRTSIEGGDGTATTTVLTQALVEEAFKEIANDSSKIQEVRERLENGLKQVLEELTKLKREVTVEDVEKIATISSLDPEIAKLIAEVIKEIGVKGVVTVEKSSKIGYSKEVVKGMRFDKGLIAPHFINNREKGECVLENPYIVLVDRKVSTNEQISSIMNGIHASGNKTVLWIADDFDGLALASLIQESRTVMAVDPAGKQTQGTYDIAVVKNPYNGERAKEFLDDVASLTGAKVLSEEAGIRLDTSTIESCGTAHKVIVTKDKCTIVGGASSKTLEERIKLIENKIADTTSDYEKEMLQDRLASLTGGIGVIKVGAYTDTDYIAKKYKFENAIHSSQAALEEGIIAGGGIALSHVASEIEDRIFKVALQAPYCQQFRNSGMKETGFGQTETGEMGVNFRTKKLVNMFDEGIIDPFKVTRLALESAVSIASTLITVESVIVDEEGEEDE